MNLYDPREGEWPEDADWCHAHQQRADTCGPCVSEELEAHAPILCVHGVDVDTFCAPCSVAGELALAAAFTKMLDKIDGRTA